MLDSQGRAKPLTFLYSKVAVPWWPRTAQQKQGETLGFSGTSFALGEIKINLAPVLWKHQRNGGQAGKQSTTGGGQDLSAVENNSEKIFETV